MITLLHVGDLMGKPGRTCFARLLPRLRARFSPDFIVVNGENSAGGRGITPALARWFFDLGVDVITSGNHIWDQHDIGAYLDSEPRLLRPANYPAPAQGQGMVTVERRGKKLTVINLQGRAFMPPIDCPFQKADALLEGVDGPVLVDFHAEATAEKKMMGHYLDGRVMALVGTHTHVPTADAHIMPRGTAYITDVGMTGSRESSIGLEFESVRPRMLYQLPARYEVAEADPWLNAVVIQGDEQWGLATDITPVLWPDPGEQGQDDE